jgi:AraC family L-rhamnose operon regulatory protein RhaS
MERYRQFQPLIISDFETEEWRNPIHNHNHYELIYIKTGSGLHHVNREVFSYRQGDLFLLGPDDHHYFDIHHKTWFVFLKCTELYFRGTGSPHQPVLYELEYLFKNNLASRIDLNATERETVKRIYEVIIHLKATTLQNELLIYYQVLTLSVILKRSLSILPASEEEKPVGKPMQDFFSYIHEHIYTPRSLRADAVAAHFNTTHNYIGAYFKRNAGMSLRKYIKQYRRTLINNKLASGNYSTKDIVVLFGLTDESHLRKVLADPPVPAAP